MCGYNSCLWLQTLLLTKDNTSECASAISWGGLQRLRRGVRGEAAGKLYLNLTGNPVYRDLADVVYHFRSGRVRHGLGSGEANGGFAPAPPGFNALMPSR